MFTASLRIRSFLLLMVVMFGILTRLLIGYSAYANPIHRFAGPSLRAATSEALELSDVRYHSFKIKRKIALKVATHYPWQLALRTPCVSLTLLTSLQLNHERFQNPFSRLRLRPPARA
jgi:hypothetical protein